MTRLAQAETDRAVQQTLRIGTVEALDAAEARVRVRIGALTTGWLPWLTWRAGADRSWWAPEAGEQVAVLTPAGRGEQAVVLGALFSDAHDAPADRPTTHRTVYADGAVIEYDRGAHALRAELPAGATVTILASGGLAITGDITLAGRLDATGDVTAGGVSLRHHVHTNVAPGGGLSGEPQK